MSDFEYYNYRNKNYYKLGTYCFPNTTAITSNFKFLSPLSSSYIQNYQKIANKEYTQNIINEAQNDDNLLNKYINKNVYYRNIYNDIIDNKLSDIQNNEYTGGSTNSKKKNSYETNINYYNNLDYVNNNKNIGESDLSYDRSVNDNIDNDRTLNDRTVNDRTVNDRTVINQQESCSVCKS